MASLTTGSVNFPNIIYENPPEFILQLAESMREYSIKPEVEVFDAAMLYQAIKMENQGLIQSPLHIQFVMGIPGAMPARLELLEFLVSELQTLTADATWSAMGTGPNQAKVNRWCLAMGGQTRTGMEDNIKITKDRLAASNAELVKAVVDMAVDYNRHPASAAEARKILNLKPA
jgi:3-keto-5-aminohexanoate cleavage enzyme